jgi:hypothetical protein
VNPGQVKKAKLVEIQWDAKQSVATPVPGGKSVEVHFNPQNLKLTYANENKGGDQPAGSSKQFVGAGTSKLSIELVFDTSDSGTDVRRTTRDVAYFIQAKPADKQKDKNNKRVPPGVEFQWGTFIFRGVVDSMSETLEFFAEDGTPLRATVSLGLSRQDIEFIGVTGDALTRSVDADAAAAQGAAGRQPLSAAQPGDSVQSMAARSGNGADWKSIAAANNIDDPLRLQAGALVNLSAGAGVSTGASASVGISFGAGGGAGAAAGASLGAGGSAGADVGFSAGLGGGVGFSAGAGTGLSAGVGASAGAGFGASAGASAGAGFGAGAGISAGAGASTGASFGASASAGGSFGAGASANSSLGGNAGSGIGAGAGLQFNAGIG